MKITKDMYIEFQADVDVAIHRAFTEGEEIDRESIIKEVAEKTGYSESMIKNYLISEMLLVRYQFAEKVFDKHKNDKDVIAINKAIEKKKKLMKR